MSDLDNIGILTFFERILLMFGSVYVSILFLYLSTQILYVHGRR